MAIFIFLMHYYIVRSDNKSWEEFLEAFLYFHIF